MVVCMKTTIDIADPLLAEAKELALQQHTTIRALVEDGLRHVLAARRERQPFELRDGRFRGEGGMREEFKGNWDAVLDAIYEGHGA